MRRRDSDSSSVRRQHRQAAEQWALTTLGTVPQRRDDLSRLNEAGLSQMSEASNRTRSSAGGRGHELPTPSIASGHEQASALTSISEVRHPRSKHPASVPTLPLPLPLDRVPRAASAGTDGAARAVPVDAAAPGGAVLQAATGAAARRIAAARRVAAGSILTGDAGGRAGSGSRT